jgi:hypothetical protein
MQYSANNSCNITFLTELGEEEVHKTHLFIDTANAVIKQYFGIQTSFDIIICNGAWEMEVQVITRREGALRSSNNSRGTRRNNNSNFQQPSLYDDTKAIGLTDYRLEEIVIRYDAARFGHYLHELIHGIISKDHPHQLREGLAWYFTLKLTENDKYTRPTYPSWIDTIYVYPTRRLAMIVGDDFLKDIALLRASVDRCYFPTDIQELFLPEEVFYSKRHHF